MQRVGSGQWSCLLRGPPRPSAVKPERSSAQIDERSSPSPTPPVSSSRQFVSRGGLKLEHALDAFEVSVRGLACADFGCNVGGFTDCLLQRGARTVYAVDTGYGILAYPLRRDDRVVTMERTNALHAPPPDPVDLVTIDLGWTPQRHAIPAALPWLRAEGRIITLVKPHFELTGAERRDKLVAGRLDPAHAARVFDRTLAAMPALGVRVLQHTTSPITGGKSSRGGTGNVEYLVLLLPEAGTPFDHAEAT